MRIPRSAVPLVGLLSLLGVSACTSAATNSELPQTTVRGLYVAQDGAHTLRPCGATDIHWVTGPDTVLEPVRTRSEARSKALGLPHQGVYAEISGGLETPPATAVPVGYDGVLHASHATMLADHLPASCVTTIPAPATPGV